jgi:hypothetical protein
MLRQARIIRPGYPHQVKKTVTCTNTHASKQGWVRKAVRATVYFGD